MVFLLYYVSGPNCSLGGGIVMAERNDLQSITRFNSVEVISTRSVGAEAKYFHGFFH